MTEQEAKQRYTKLNKMGSNNMIIRATLNKWGYTFNLKYHGKPEKNTSLRSGNFWANADDGYWGEGDAIERLKANVCKSIDAQREVIVRELKKAGLYEPADL